MTAKGLTEDDVVAYVGGICFKTGPPGLLGVESEWLVTDPARPGQHVPLPRLKAAVAAADPLPAASSVTYEPGGQLELSSLPHYGVRACHAALRADLAHIHQHLATAGLELSGWGLDPIRTPTRQLDDPRYAAMETFFDTHSSDSKAGRAMMCSTASVQVCVDVGETLSDLQQRWDLAHALGPVLVASFANSPLSGGRATGWQSTRQAVWSALDPCRTGPPAGTDPVQAFSRYALDAPVLAIRRDDAPWVADPGVTFRQWLHGGGSPGHPSLDDLAFHLSTLFPPVRPRGFLELRMVDAQFPAYWAVPLAVVAALFDDPTASDVARDAAEPVRDSWPDAARHALAEPALGRAARRCFEAAQSALGRLGADAELRAAVAEFAERYVDRGRCPADDTAAAFRNSPRPGSRPYVPLEATT